MSLPPRIEYRVPDEAARGRRASTVKPSTTCYIICSSHEKSERAVNRHRSPEPYRAADVRRCGNSLKSDDKWDFKFCHLQSLFEFITKSAFRIIVVLIKEILSFGHCI